MAEWVVVFWFFVFFFSLQIESEALSINKSFPCRVKPVIFHTCCLLYLLKSLSLGYGVTPRVGTADREHKGFQVQAAVWWGDELDTFQSIFWVNSGSWGLGVSRMRSQVKNPKRGFAGASDTVWCDPCQTHQGTPIPRKQMGKHRVSLLIPQKHSLETKAA